MPRTTLVLTVVAVLAAVAGAGVASVVGRRRAGAAALAAGLAVAGGSLAAAAVLLTPLGLGFFGLLHLAYLGLVLTLPLLGGTLLVSSTLRRSLLRSSALTWLLLLPAPVGVYATHVEPRWLRVDEVAVTVAADRSGEDVVRIGVLADLQTADPGSYERGAIDRLVAADPDVILLPGDLLQVPRDRSASGIEELRPLLARLHAPGGVYFVRGDVDDGDRADRLLEGTGVVILDDKAVDVRVGDRLLRIGGTRLDVSSHAADALRHELAAGEDGAIRVLVSHRPDTVLSLPPRSRVDLTVAGHTHGGQVVIPGVGPLVTLSDVPRHVARGGLHRVDGNAIYVSPGVGLERGQAPQVRFLNRPAVAVLVLRDG